MASNVASSWLFLFAFAKNERDNIDKVELRYFQEVAKTLLELSTKQLDVAVNDKELMEIEHGNG